MSAAPGQAPGQAPELTDALSRLDGFDWGSWIAGLVATHGSLAGVAEKLAESRGYAERVESVERALRRLRGKGHGEGGVWGRRALKAFGLPRDVESRVRWMGQYHTRFTDLPVSLCEEQLLWWDKPPIASARERVWLQLGLASVSLRRRDHQAADQRIRQAGLVKTAPDAARAELALVRSFRVSRRDPAAAAALLDEAEALLDGALTPEDRACLHARWVDQRAYPLNRPRSGPADHPAAEAWYLRIPEGGPPFVIGRRENGLGWSRLAMGQRDAAVHHARRSVAAAGDGGHLRLRVMALKLLSTALGGDEGGLARDRASAIAARLEDEELRLRLRPR